MNLMPRTNERTNETELDFHLASLSDISKTSTQRGIDIMVVEGGGKLCLYLLRNNVRDQWPANLIKNGPTPASFCLFSFFSNTNVYRKNGRLQRDSKSDRRSRRRARLPLDHHHGLAHFINVPVFWLYLHDPIDTVSNLVFWSCQVNNLEPWHIVFIMQQ